MNAELLTSFVVLLSLALGCTGAALVVGWALGRLGPVGEAPQRARAPGGVPNSESPAFADVMPRVAALLSTSSPALQLKNVLVPVDFSEGSLRALPYASFLANQFGCRVTLLYVVPLGAIDYERRSAASRSLGEVESAACHTLGEMGQSLSGTTRSVVRVGEPVNEVLKEVAASSIDLIVIGRRGRDRTWHRLLPSVESRLVRHVPCPTLVIG